MDRVDGGRLALATAPVVGKQQRSIDELRREMDALMGRVNAGQSNPDGTY
jgi:hypothetical protein